MQQKVLEKNIAKRIISALNKIPMTRVWKRRAGPFEKGRADITGASRGVRVEIEVKRPGEQPTDLQAKWLREMRELGCISGVAYSEEDAIEILESFFPAQTTACQSSCCRDRRDIAAYKN
jgi:hypothetical protein